MRAKFSTPFLVVLAVLICPQTGSSASVRATEIDVTLFGQPCTLTGPVDKPTLQLIHSISPERMPIPESLEQSRKSLQAARKITSTPAALDRYRSQLVRRLEAQETFFEAYNNAKKSKRAQALFEDVKTFQSADRARRFETAVNKLLADKGWASISTDDVSTLYNDSLDVFPEEEFHRAIQKMGVRYVCSFESEDESEGEDGG